MKIFHDGDKVNFVDENNVLVGYDMGQCCCENADWFLSNTEDRETGHGIETEGKDFEQYNFDKKYFVEVEDAVGLDSGGMVRFRLMAPDNPTLYLHLYNSHNGYYSHGFQMKNNEELMQSGSL